MEETREEFLNLCMPSEENPDEREPTRTVQSAEGARAWSELFVPDTPNGRIQAENRTTSLEEDFSPDNAVVGSKTTVRSSVGVQNNTGF